MDKLNLYNYRMRYKSEVAAFPAVFCCDYLASELCEKEYGDRTDSVIYFFTDEYFGSCINSYSDAKRLANLLIDKFFANPDYLDKLLDWCENNRNLLSGYLDEHLNDKTLAQLTGQELGDRYHKFCELYRDVHLKDTTPWWVATEFLTERVKDRARELGRPLADNVLGELVDALDYKTENLAEELSLLEIAAQLEEKKIEYLDETGLENDQNIKKIFEKHIANYRSLPFGYNTGIVWDKAFFLEKLNSLLKKASPKKVLEDRLKVIDAKKVKQKKLLSGLGLPRELELYIINLRKLAYLQELKKVIQTRSHPALQLFVKPEIAKRLNTSVRDLDYMSHIEIRYSLTVGQIDPNLRSKVERRRKYAILIMKDLRFEWLTGQEARDFAKIQGFENDVSKDIKEITGMPTSRGIVRGTVIICRSSRDIDKIKTGYILVAGSTTPDFVPAMRNAAAIVTDEGGITSHAAIVSRELGKPCIVGTKIATKVLKDGDVVEVNADAGTVKILKKVI